MEQIFRPARAADSIANRTATMEQIMSHISNTLIDPASQAHEAVEQSRQHQSESLDEGLSESFPASDPVAVSITCIIPASVSSRNTP